MTRSIRSFLATHNLLAVSARQRETALNTEQVLDTTLLVDLQTILQQEALKIANDNESTGREEADRLDDLGATVQGNLAFSRAQPQHLAFLLAYALGEVETSPMGVSGFRHLIRPRAGELDVSRSLPSFTAAMRFGRQVMKQRYASCFIDQVRLEFPKDGWAKINGVIRGTGQVTDNSLKEEVTAPYNAASLALVANGVAGDGDAERFANVQAVQVKNPLSQAWEEVDYTAVSATTPAVLSIAPPGMESDPTVYRVYYLPQESAWMDFPARVQEPPLKVSQVEVVFGGRWDGAAFLGGYTLRAELRRLLWTFQNQISLETTPGNGLGFANRAFRAGRKQKLELDRDFRDVIVSRHLKDNEYFSLYVKATGPEFEPGFHYQVELVFPKVAVLSAPVKVSQRRLMEAVQLAVLEDDNFGSVVVYVQNQVAGYAAG